MAKTQKDTKATGSPMDDLRAKLMKDFGAEAIIPMTKAGANYLSQNIKFISSGSIGLNKALGRPGLPLGRIVEIYGPESSGKTTLALHVLAEAHKLGYKGAYVDAEHALDVGYAKEIGVSFKEKDLILSQPDYGEQAIDIVRALIESGLIKVIVIDSVAALTPKAEIEGDTEKNHVGLQARMMSQALRAIAGRASKMGVMVIFINQIRMKIGVMFGSPETTSGGNALKFFASVRLDIRRIGGVKDNSGDEVVMVANKTRIRVVKNKLAPPFREVELEIKYGVGFDKIGEIIDLAVKAGIIDQAGAWFSYKGDRLAQGLFNTKARLAEPEMKDCLAEITAKIIALDESEE